MRHHAPKFGDRQEPVQYSTSHYPSHDYVLSWEQWMCIAKDSYKFPMDSWLSLKPWYYTVSNFVEICDLPRLRQSWILFTSLKICELELPGTQLERIVGVHEVRRCLLLGAQTKMDIHTILHSHIAPCFSCDLKLFRIDASMSVVERNRMTSDCLLFNEVRKQMNSSIMCLTRTTEIWKLQDGIPHDGISYTMRTTGMSVNWNTKTITSRKWMTRTGS